MLNLADMSGRKHLKLLLADDDKTITTIYEFALHQGAPFDAVVLDIHMPPGIDGVEAAKTIRPTDHGVPIIFVSGYSDISVSELQQRIPPSRLLQYVEKPIQLTQLATRIREVTSGGQTATPAK